MQKDQRGYPVATDDAKAVQALDRAFDAYVGFRTDIMAHLNDAITTDPQFALPQIARGILLVGLRKPELYALARDALEAAKNGHELVSERERHYLAALEASLAGKITTTVRHFEKITDDYPQDLFALRLGQFELFWLGEVAWMRDISERAASKWSSTMPGYSAYLSIRAFGLEENGDYALAEQCGRESVERDPSDYWGAHVMVMQGRLRDGITWLSDLADNWSEANHIVHHLWWHLALFHTEHGDYDAALGLYDNKLRDLDSPLMQAIPDFYIDIQNDVSLLQRLEFRGVDIQDRWQPIADLAQARIDNHTSPFTSAHCALALAAAGRYREADELIRLIKTFAEEDIGTLAPRYALAALPASEAAVAHSKGEHQRVIDILMPARKDLWQMGGSHAQRDLFFQLLVDSAFKMERRDILNQLLHELGAIGFDHIAERSSYSDAVAMAG